MKDRRFCQEHPGVEKKEGKGLEMALPFAVFVTVVNLCVIAEVLGWF